MFIDISTKVLSSIIYIGSERLRFPQRGWGGSFFRSPAAHILRTSSGMS